MDLIKMLLEVELRATEIQEFETIVGRIRDFIEGDIGFDTGFPSDIWLAGIFRTPGESVNKALTAYKEWIRKYKETNGEDSKPNFSSDEVRDSMTATAQEGRRIFISYQILKKYGYVQNGNSLSGYVFNRNGPMADKSSRFRFWLSDEKNLEKFKADTKAVVRAANEQANEEWANSLSSKDRQFLEIYKGLSIESFRLLTHVASLHKNKSYDSANRLLADRIDSGDASAITLQKLGLVKDNGNLDYQKVMGLLDFLESPPNIAPNQVAQALETFNKEVAFMVKRKEANRALTQNALDKKLGGHYTDDTNGVEKQVLDKLNSMTPSEMDAAISFGKQDMDDMDVALLKRIGVLDQGGEPTEMGEVVINVARASGGDPGKFTERLQAMSRINKHERRFQRAINQTRTATNLFGDLKKNIRYGKK